MRRRWGRWGGVADGLTGLLVVPTALVLGACALTADLVSAGEQAGAKPRPLRRLRGQELRDAREARGQADRLRAAFESAYGRRSPLKEGREEAFKEAEAAYRKVIEQYPDTEVAAYCLVRLSGLYQFAGRRDKAEAVLKDVVTRFAGTEYESKAYFELGLHYLQALHDPGAAIPWLGKVQPPATAGDDGVVPQRAYSVADKRYIGAQQTLAKCEVRLGRPADAAARIEALADRYPYYVKSFGGTVRFEVRSALSDRSLAPIHPVLKAWQEAHPE